MQHIPTVMVVGAFGKMGMLACETIDKNKHYLLLAKIGRQDDLSQAISNAKPNIILDLTNANSVFKNCEIYLQTTAHFVIGASGLRSEEISHIRDKCQSRRQGALIVPNFSIGATLQIYFAKLAARWFDAVDIIEMHHHLKQDSPSGTALHTAKEIHAQKSHWPEVSHQPMPGRETFFEEIPIHAVRMPGVVAMQQILFGQKGETLNLSHQVIDRLAYMPGLMLALEKVQTLEELVCGLDRWLI